MLSADHLTGQQWPGTNNGELFRCRKTLTLPLAQQKKKLP
jgi:hypothetical protein